MKRILFALLLGSCIISCNKPEVGFFSEKGIQMREDTFVVIKGIYQMSSAPMVDGSTRPLNFELKNVIDVATGEPAPDFWLATHEINMWISAFNAKTDTTMAIVNQKLIKRQVAPLEVNPYSGQLVFNSATAYLNAGVFQMDVQATNSKDSKLLEKFGVVKLLSKPFEVLGNFGDYLKGVDRNGVEYTIKDFNPYTAEEHQQIRENKHPLRKLYNVASSDIVELHLVIKDSRGQVIDPNFLTYMIDEEDPASYYNCYHDNSLALDGDKVEYTDTSCIFHFPTTPYPAFGRKYNDGDNIYLVYYTISSKAYNLAPEYQTMANQQAASEGEVFESYRVSFKNSYKINEPGVWHMEVVSPYIIKK